MNEHDLHGAFGDLARRGADDQAARLRNGAGLSAADITRRAARARQRRAGASAVTGVVVVAGLVLGGGALTHRPEPQPADTPSPTVTRPSPAPSRTPAPTPTSSPTSTGSALDTGDPVADVVPIGLLRRYAGAPRVAWTVPGAELRPPGSEDAFTGLGDVTASMHAFSPFRAVAAGGGWMVAAGGFSDERLVTVDSASGGLGWVADGGPDGVISCGGGYDGLMVCLGRVGTSTDTEVQLRDPATGAVVRTAGSGGHGLAVVGDIALVFDSNDTDVHLRTIDLAPGATRRETTAAGLVQPDMPVGDGVVSWESAGSLVLVHGYQYNLAVDVTDLSVRARTLTVPTAVRADGWVTGPGADESLRAVGPQGQEVPLPGGADVATPSVWAPTTGAVVPLLTGSSPYDGAADRVTALDTGSGATLWSVPGVWSADGVVGETALLRGDGVLVAVDVRTGAERWRSATSGELVGFDGTRVVIGTDDGSSRAVALDLSDGSETWSLPLPDQRVEQVDGTLVGIGADGSLSALLP
ncbi:PQQ-binding-like beta-propeller repeat protein [Cellulosimicrobium cellulans]|uniref:outer membrane protein assembly factor BamB family protein n=1 Tax=Cellulosimicrobium cellulans TaxID=1710 RepID=UPI00130DA44C|nr:PQQ-binding-like beta-propeller repeat protein [Cellulosimicrobium cellulans]